VVAGGTGFIGRALCQGLEADGFDVVALSWVLEEDVDLGGESIETVDWDGRSADPWAHLVDGARAVINLTGENVATERWTPAKKRKILRSRVDAARAVAGAVRRAKHRPEVVIQGSAIAYYGRHGDEVIDETSGSGSGFFAAVVREMEEAARDRENLGVRRVVLRTGVVLGRDGGLLPGMVRSFRRFLGGHAGNGEQWVSWIHIFDVVRAVRFLMERRDLEGPFNLTAPEGLPQRQLAAALGRATGRPSWLPTPAFLLRLRYGEMADAVMLSGARVEPKRLVDAGFEFLYPDVTSALREIMTRET